MKTSRATLLAMLMCVVTEALAALPEPVRQLSSEWSVTGSAEMRWWGLKLYDAELWTGGDRFNPDALFALQLTYARDISRERLVDSSIDEMQRLGKVDLTQLSNWREQLVRVFPDVRKGERIVGVSLPGRGAQFYHQGRLTGEVDDAKFARAFFGIWLDPRTRAPDVRSQLIGVRGQ